METGIEKYISETFDISIPAKTTHEQLEIFLAERINHLIVNDFSLLVHILYRIDVSEKKLKTLLKENSDSNTGRIIACLVIERQLQKIRSRQESGRDDKDIIDENESW
ncbi:MAG: hypothetical protein ABI741_11160 [Ferruginibacter sp.]